SRGLTDQIRDELNRMGYNFVGLDPNWVHCSGACVDVLQGPAAAALVEATKAKNDYITRESGKSTAPIPREREDEEEADTVCLLVAFACIWCDEKTHSELCLALLCSAVPAVQVVRAGRLRHPDRRQ